MEEDRIPLSTWKPKVVIETRAKFDSLLDEAINKKGARRSSKRSKKAISSLAADHNVSSSANGSKDEHHVIDPPTAAPRHHALKKSQSVTSVNSQNISSKNVGIPFTSTNDEPQEPMPAPRHNSKRRDEENVSTSTVITIQEEEDSSSHAESSVSPRQKKHQLPPLSRVGGPAEYISSQRSSKKKHKKKDAENIELRPLSSQGSTSAVAPTAVSTDRLAVLLHGCQVPSPLAPRSLSVRVHVVDIESGRELHTSEQTAVQAQTSESTTDIRNRFATFDQELNFPAPLQLAVENSVILFFELLIPLSQTSTSTSCYTRLEGEERCVGWSFLKLKAANGNLNCNSKLRLQVHEPLTNFRRQANQDFKLVHSWWCRGPWRKTQCSLFVTVHGVSPRHPPTPESAAPEAAGAGEKQQLNQMSDSPLKEVVETSQMSPDWLRRQGQLCKVASLPHKVLPVRTANCLAMAFSGSGNLLACAAKHNVIYLYQFPAFTELCGLSGHQGLVYALCWHKDSLLLSAAADCTVVLWDVAKKQISKVLPHPSFVYCCQFLPGHRGQAVVTGGKDQVIRVWRQAQPDADFDLWQELEGHEGFVTSLSIVKVDQLISADSEGVILMWAQEEREQDWRQVKELLVSGLRGTSVSSAIAHPAGSRVLVHARDSLVRMVDLASGATVQQYLGALSHKVQTGACLSPCGGLVMAGGEEGSVSIWQAETGRLLAHCEPPSLLSAPTTSLAYHPSAHLMLSGYFGWHATPVKIWIHGGQVKEEDIEDSRAELYKSTTSQSEDQLRLQDIIARIDQVLTSATPTE